MEAAEMHIVGSLLRVESALESVFRENTVVSAGLVAPALFF